MTTQSKQPKDDDSRARAFIEQVISINRAHGMGVSQDAVEQAVADSAAIAASFHRSATPVDA